MKKLKWIGIGALVLLLAWFFFLRGGEDAPNYVTERAELRDVAQSISVTGSAEPAVRVAVSSNASDQVLEQLVQEGETVTAGQVLYRLNDADARFSVAQAQAQLAQARAQVQQISAGATSQEIAIAEQDVKTARVNVAAAEERLQNVKNDGGASTDETVQRVETAKKDLQVAQERLALVQSQNAATVQQSGQGVTNALENRETAKRAAMTAAEDTLIEANTILRVNLSSGEANVYPNATFGNKSKRLRSSAIAAYGKYDRVLKQLRNGPVEELSASVLVSLLKVATELNGTVREVIVQTTPNQVLSTAQIEQARATVDGFTSTLRTTLNSLEMADQAIVNAELGTDTTDAQTSINLQNAEAEVQARTEALAAVELAVASSGSQINTSVSAAAADVDRAQEALQSAELRLAQVRAGARSVDTASARAGVEVAQVGVEQAEKQLADRTITSPIDGVVTQLMAEVGERISIGQTVAEVMTPNLQLVANVPETDIAPMTKGMTAVATFDSFSDDDEYDVVVQTISPSETVIQGVIYYETEFIFAPGVDVSTVRPGMTANIDIVVEARENVLSIDPQAIMYNDDGPYVRIAPTVEDDKAATPDEEVSWWKALTQTPEVPAPTEVPLSLGLEGDRWTEVLRGLDEGDEIILFEETE